MVNQKQKVMNKQRIFMLVTALIGLVAAFLPWVKIPVFGTMTGIEGDGMLTASICVISAVVILTGKRKQTVSLVRSIFIGLLGAALLAVIIYKFIDFGNMQQETTNNPFIDAFSQNMSIGSGIYLTGAAGVFMILWCLPFWGRKRELQLK